MNPNIPSIEQLKEMALPAPVSYAPQTWGWWLLLGLLVMTSMIVAARRYWQWRRDRYRREALARLAQLQQRSGDLNALRELPELLKRVAISMPAKPPVGASLLAKAARHSTKEVTDTLLSRAGSLPQATALGGKDWQDFLQAHTEHPLPNDFSQQLALLAYAPDETLQALPNEHRQHLFQTCKHWVEHHHVAV
ncbi:DUF4381 domain-containing protein [Pseudomonas sp. 18173]|uniref:DUF4381 domain-containing protein n=1 Tax=Pseudomonas sp. 18173 TaxID=3390055 RepID=UPI003D1A1226